MQLYCVYAIIREYDCERYALKREVAQVFSRKSVVFPWSMSDFKPGDYKLKAGTVKAFYPHRPFMLLTYMDYVLRLPGVHHV